MNARYWELVRRSINQRDLVAVAQPTYSVQLTDGIAGWVAYRGDLDTAERVAATWEGATARGLAITATIRPNDPCPIHGEGCEAWA